MFSIAQILNVYMVDLPTNLSSLRGFATKLDRLRGKYIKVHVLGNYAFTP